MNIIHGLGVIVFRQDHITLIRIILRHTVLVLGIDKATTHLVALHVDEVELNHARHIAVVLFLSGAVLGGQL